MRVLNHENTAWRCEKRSLRWNSSRTSGTKFGETEQKKSMPILIQSMKSKQTCSANLAIFSLLSANVYLKNMFITFLPHAISLSMHKEE